MSSLEDQLKDLAEPFRDHRLNLKTALSDSSLPAEERFAVAVAAAAYVGDTALVQQLRNASDGALTQEGFEDALAAAAIMSMNTVYYRSVHMLGKPTYEQMPPSLRMNRMMKPAASKRLFELCSLACAALAGCQRCLVSHEATLRKEEATEQQVHDVLRTAAIVQGVASAIALSGAASTVEK